MYVGTPPGWSDAEEEILIRMAGDGAGSKEIGFELGRSEGSVRLKARQLGVKIAPALLWPEAKVEELRQLAKEGLRASEIARRMRITKGAIVGKAHRLRISIPGRQSKPLRPKRATNPSRSSPNPVHREAPLLPVNSGTTLFRDLRSPELPRECRWIDGDPAAAGEELLCCGAPVMLGSSWCEHHYRKVFRADPRDSRELKHAA